MVTGINFISHVLAFIAFAVLIYVLFVMRRRQEFLAKFLAPFTQANPAKAVQLDWPTTFLKNLSSTLGIEYQGPLLKSGKPAVIHSQVWFDMFLSHGISLIRCNQEQQLLVIELKPVRNIAVDESRRLAAILADALGGDVRVQII